MSKYSGVILGILILFYIGVLIGSNIVNDKFSYDESLLRESNLTTHEEQLNYTVNLLQNVTKSENISAFYETREDSYFLNVFKIFGKGITEIAIETATSGVEYGYEKAQDKKEVWKIKIIFPLIIIYSLWVMKNILIILSYAIYLLIKKIIIKIPRGKNS